MPITQINLNHCDAVQQLLYQAVCESATDIAIIADPYRIPAGNGSWVVVSTSNEDFAVAKVNGVFFCSCYAPPRWFIKQFSQFVGHMTVELTGLNPVVIAGDFNAWALE